MASTLTRGNPAERAQGQGRVTSQRETVKGSGMGSGSWLRASGGCGIVWRDVRRGGESRNWKLDHRNWKLQNLNSKTIVWNPYSGIRSLEFGIQSPESGLPNLKSEMLIPEHENRNSDS